MPGTPTPNLNLAVPTVGGDVGSWGNELNGNLQTLDSAIALGVITVSTSTLIAVMPNVGLLVRVITGSSTINITLPPPTSSPRPITIKKIDSGTGTVFIFGNVDGFLNTLQLVNQYQYVTVVPNGTAYDIYGNN